MSFLRLIFLLPWIFATPQPRVNWVDTFEKALIVRVEGEDDILPGCLEGGLEMRYRYEVTLCSSRTMWFDNCKDQHLLVKTLEHDPISGKFIVSADEIGDTSEAVKESFDSLNEARASLGQLNALSTLALADNDANFLARSKKYLQVGVSGECVGDYNRTLSRISSVLTLGLVRPGGFSVGPNVFVLHK